MSYLLSVYHIKKSRFRYDCVFCLLLYSKSLQQYLIDDKVAMFVEWVDLAKAVIPNHECVLGFHGVVAFKTYLYQLN